jgi:hypothetical protein
MRLVIKANLKQVTALGAAASCGTALLEAHVGGERESARARPAASKMKVGADFRRGQIEHRSRHPLFWQDHSVSRCDNAESCKRRKSAIRFVDVQRSKRGRERGLDHEKDRRSKTKNL